MSGVLAGGSEAVGPFRFHNKARYAGSDVGEKSYWWDFGIVYLTRTDAKLSLMKFEDNEVQSCAASFDFDFFEGTGFAFVGSKLYAFGRRHHDDSEGLDFFVCDLSSSSSSSRSSGQPKSYEFKQAGKLRGPKTCPIVIPYHDKIYIIPTGITHSNRSRVPSFAEVLHLPSHESHVLETPFDQAYKSDWTFFPESTGFTVLGKYAFMHLYSELWFSSQRLFCLNMDTGKWIFDCFDSKSSSLSHKLLRSSYLSHKDESCSSCYEYNNDPYYLMYQNAAGRLWGCLNKICQEDKIFVVRREAADRSLYPKELRVFVSDIIAQDSCGEPVLHPLESLQNLVNQQIRDMSCPRKAWTLPLAIGKNWFCLFVWYMAFVDEDNHSKGSVDQLFTCTFKLLDKSLAEDDSAMDTDDSAGASALGSNSRYDCVNLSHAIYKHTFPDVASPQYAFTPVSTFTFPSD